MLSKEVSAAEKLNYNGSPIMLKVKENKMKQIGGKKVSPIMEVDQCWSVMD